MTVANPSTSLSLIKVTTSTALSSGTDPTTAASYTKTAVASRSIPANTLIATNPSTTLADTKAYSSVQISATQHIELNSDLLYCNHSCDPNVIFNVDKLSVEVVGEKERLTGGLEIWSLREIREGEELRFFYPSTEWDMAQGFECSCGATQCLGLIAGARSLSDEVLSRYWLSQHIKELLKKRESVQV